MRILTDRELVDLARAAAEKAYSPYSNFTVGAAIECEDGTIFKGCNVENASYGLSICAERTAAVKAVSAGHRVFRRIAVYGSSAEYCMPCGACRQFLNEFCDDMAVLCSNRDGAYASYMLSDLLPHSFKL